MEELDQQAEQAKELKLTINQFIWSHGPASMTLGCAEELAVLVFNKLCPEPPT